MTNSLLAKLATLDSGSEILEEFIEDIDEFGESLVLLISVGGTNLCKCSCEEWNIGLSSMGKGRFFVILSEIF